jgi:hypothetical protein
MYNHPNNDSNNSSRLNQQQPQQQMQQRHQHNVNRPPLDKYERFESWLRENGAQFDLVSFTSSLCSIWDFFSKREREREKKILPAFCVYFVPLFD